MGVQTAFVETGCNAIDKYLRTKTDLSNITTIGYRDGGLNLSRMSFGKSTSFPVLMRETMAEVTKALSQDIEPLGLRKVSISMSWPYLDLKVTLSLRGAPKITTKALDSLFTVVNPKLAPSEWIEPLSVLIKQFAPLSLPVGDLSGVTHGILSIKHSDEVYFDMLMPDAIKKQLVVEDIPFVNGK